MDSSSASAGFFLLDINKHAIVDDDDDDDSQLDTPAAAAVAVDSVAVAASENVGESSGWVLMRNFDMNSLPSGAEDDGSGSSSAMSMVCSSPGHGAVPCCAADDDCNLNGHSGADEEGSAPAEPSVVAPRKKLRLSKEQAALLEESFREHHTLNPKQKNALAKQLNLKSRQVEVWFQNRRARTKLKQTEVDCELLKRCCENLTEENRRLKREVEELRATRVGLGVGLGLPCMVATHHHSHNRNHQSHNHQDMFMQLPAATVGICPSCNRLDKKLQPSLHFVPKNVVTASSSSSAAAAAHSHAHAHAYCLAAAFRQPSAAPC